MAKPRTKKEMWNYPSSHSSSRTKTRRAEHKAARAKDKKATASLSPLL